MEEVSNLVLYPLGLIINIETDLSEKPRKGAT
jgi:hypothetical protein